MSMDAKEVQAIAEAVSKAVVTAINVPTVEQSAVEPQQEVIYTDECVKAADEEEMALIKCLPRGTVVYKGRGSSQMVNHTEESMNFLNDWRRNRKSWRTRVNVR